MGFKIQKKKSVSKRVKPTGTKSKKNDLRTGYNEGAEENKNWLGDSQTTFTHEPTITNEPE